MKKIITKAKHGFRKLEKQIHDLPIFFKIPIAVFLIVLGILNIINPFVNGVIIIIIWSSIIVKSFSQKD